ncbi:transglycosylase SLT domain-containing protein [Aristophania vespae]|uniref:transglycosylase SLT domain-containing protein n=1 Tax=Aristophania vespae TaxID=2697033 RepID=UPI00350E4D5E
MRNQYNLGPDPYNPRDNILAGTAYIRQMYEIYGSPGFLAAYNDGPGNVDHYLRQNRPLPKETRNYVKAIGPKIAGIWPKNRSKADLMVARYDRTAQRRSSVDTSSLNTTSLDDGASAAESLTDSSSSSVAAPSDNQSVSSVWASRGFSPASPPVRAKKPRPAPEPKHVVEVRSIPLAHPTRKRGRATDIIQSARTDWAIQIGSYASKKQASVVANKLRHFVVSSKGKTRTTIMAVHVKGRVLYRARYTGLTRAQAYSSCQRLTAITPCFAISP